MTFTETPAPTEEEVDLLRREIDPWGVRKLELLSGVERRDLLHQILDWEEQAFLSPNPSLLNKLDETVLACLIDLPPGLPHCERECQPFAANCTDNIEERALDMLSRMTPEDTGRPAFPGVLLRAGSRPRLTHGESNLRFDLQFRGLR